MFEIEIFKYDDGRQPIKEFLDALEAKKDKNSRINFNKIERYLSLLSTNGFSLTYPIIRHISGEIWELRPLNNRIFFFCFHKDTFVLLHHFIKRSLKTPRIEIKRAQDNLKIYLKREINNGNNDGE